MKTTVIILKEKNVKQEDRTKKELQKQKTVSKTIIRTTSIIIFRELFRRNTEWIQVYYIYEFV